MNAQAQYETRIRNAWRDQEGDETRAPVMRDGEVVRVRLTMMDDLPSEARAALTEAALPDDKRAVLDSAQRDADRVAAFADHFTAERERREQNSGISESQRQYEARIAGAYRGAA